METLEFTEATEEDTSMDVHAGCCCCGNVLPAADGVKCEDIMARQLVEYVVSSDQGQTWG